LSDLVLLVYVELLQWCVDAIWWRWKEMAWLAYARLCMRVAYASKKCPLGGALGGFIYAAS
jgi:hypothetical protein